MDNRGATTGASESLEKEFQKVFQEIVLQRPVEEGEPPSLDLQRLQELWRQVRDNENRLTQRCRELQTQLAANKARSLATGARMREHQAIVASLKKEIENAWKMVDDSHGKEQKARETIEHLQMQVEQLSRVVEHSTSLALTQERMSELQMIKDELTEKNEQLRSTIGELQEEVTLKQEKLFEYEDETSELRAKLEKSESDVQNKCAEYEREVRLKEKLELEYRKAKTEAENKNKIVQVLAKQNAEFEKRFTSIDQMLHQKEESLESTKSQLTECASKLLAFQKDVDSRQKQIEKMAIDLRLKNQQLSVKEHEFSKLNKDHAKLSTLKESLYSKIQQLRDQASESEHNITTLKSSVTVFEKEAAAAKKQATQDGKTIEELVRERDIMSKSSVKLTSQQEKQLDIIKTHEQTRHSLEQEIAHYKGEIMCLQKSAAQLEKERDKLHSENGALKSKIISLSEELKAQEMLLLDHQKKLSDSESDLSRQIVLYDTLKCERNLLSKNNVKSQDEVAEFKRKLKKRFHQLGQLKESLNTKEEEVFREQLERTKLQKDKEGLRDELQQANDTISKLRAELDNAKTKEQSLLQLVTAMESERSKQSQFLEKLNVEKSSLGSRLAQISKENSDFQNQITVMEAAAARTENQNQALTKDARLLKLEVKRLKSENEGVARGLNLFEDLQGDVCRLEKELMKEKLRSKALESELENPANIHRWRRLVGSDPKTYELIQKVHFLQKRLIVKTEQVVDVKCAISRERSVKSAGDLSKIDTDSKRNSSGIIPSEKMLEFQQSFREKDRQIKSLVSEQTVYMSELEKSKSAIQALTSELRDAKYSLLILRKTHEHNKRNSEGGWTASTQNVLPKTTSSLSRSGTWYLQGQNSLTNRRSSSGQ